MVPASRRVPALVALALSTRLLLAPTLAAQGAPTSTLTREVVPPTWAASAVTVAVHAVEAGVRARLGHRPVRAALWRGAMGGAVAEAGRRAIADGPTSTLWAGPLLSAAGARMAVDAGAGRPMLREGTIPAGPLVVSWARGDAGWRVRPRLSLFTAAVTADAMARGGRPDWRASAATGTIVLRARTATLPSRSGCDGCRGAFARTTASLVVMGASDGLYYDRTQTLRHETVHLAQQATDVAMHAAPASEPVAARMGIAGRLTSGWLAWDVVLPLRALNEGVGLATGDAHTSWYELEARARVRGRSCLRAWSSGCPR